jgi:hypothetical protein
MYATIADEWFDAFLEKLEADAKRVRRAISELYRPLPAQELRNRAYQQETEQQRALLHRAQGREVHHG